MTRTDRRTLVRQLRDEGLSQRAMAERLKVGKDTIRRDLEAIERQDARDAAPVDAPQDAPVEPDAPQVTAGDPPVGAPVDAPPSAPPTEAARATAPVGAPTAQLPRRTSPQRLTLDLRHWPALRRDLASLGSTGLHPDEVVDLAVRVLAAGYRQAIAQGAITPGRFVVRDMVLTPDPPGRAEPAPPAGEA